MKLDIVTRNGQIVDIENRTYINTDIGIKGDRVVDIPHHSNLQAETVIDASGCIILPGLIDFHDHIFHSGTAISVNPDIVCLPNGVTSMVDIGSSGWVNYSLFRNNAVHPTMVKTKSYLNAVSVGLSTLSGGPTGYLENTNPANYNKEKIVQTLNDNRDNILGLRLRYSQDIAQGKQYASDPLLTTVALARKPETPICAYVTDSLLCTNELTRYLEGGDIYTHYFHGAGHSILSEQGRVYATIKEMQSRGVIFDYLNGVTHFDFRVAQSAMEQGFYPDIINTDLTLRNSLCTNKVYSLLHMMSKYLDVGMSFFDIIRAVTTTPARLVRMQRQIDTLATNTIADISIVKLRKDKITFEDTRGKTLEGDCYLDDCATICNGQIVYRRLRF